MYGIFKFINYSKLHKRTIKINKLNLIILKKLEVFFYKDATFTQKPQIKE